MLEPWIIEELQNQEREREREEERPRLEIPLPMLPPEEKKPEVQDGGSIIVIQIT
jgi:hypothetical protein